MDYFFNPIFWIIFVFAVPIMTITSIGITANETNKTFRDIFWTKSSQLYPSPIIPNIPSGMEVLTIALAIWFLIVLFLWVITALFDKVILTDEFIQYYGKRAKLSDIERISIGEAGLSAIAKIYPAVPQPSELPQAALKRKEKLDLPRWLISSKFFEDLEKRAPEIKINLPKPKPYLWSSALFIFLVFVAIIVGFAGGFAWFLWVLKLPFTHLGNFNFVEFFKDYPFIEKIAIGAGGLMAVVVFLFWSFSLFLIYDKNWRKTFLILLAFLGFLHFLGWFLYYFGILK